MGDENFGIEPIKFVWIFLCVCDTMRRSLTECDMEEMAWLRPKRWKSQF